nr:hypothetical protein CFP56_66092 [Quercus suber]
MYMVPPYPSFPRETLILLPETTTLAKLPCAVTTQLSIKLENLDYERVMSRTKLEKPNHVDDTIEVTQLKLPSC